MIEWKQSHSLVTISHQSLITRGTLTGTHAQTSLGGMPHLHLSLIKWTSLPQHKKKRLLN